MTARSIQVKRIGAGSVAAALAMSTFALVGTANAALPVAGAGVDVRPVPTQNPTLPKGTPDLNGFQSVPVVPNNGTTSKVKDFQVALPSMFNQGDKVRVTLPQGVTFDSVPTVTVLGPTTLTALRESATAPASSFAAPATLTADKGTLIAQFGIGSDAPTATSPVPPTAGTRYVLSFTGVSVNVANTAAEGALVAQVSGQDRGVTDPTTGVTVDPPVVPFINVTTTLAYVTNVGLTVGTQTIVAGGGDQSIGAVNFSETVPSALVDGAYTVTFNQRNSDGTVTPVNVRNSEDGSPVTVSGSATRTSNGLNDPGNAVNITLGGLSNAGSLESFALNGILLAQPSTPGAVPSAGPITATLTARAGTSATANLVNFTPNNGQGDLSRVPAKVGIDATNTITVNPAAANRIGGPDRYATSALIAQALGQTNTFVVASGEPSSDGVDALAANYLAGSLAKNAGVSEVPVLLTKAGLIPDATRAAISSLSNNPGQTSRPPTTIYVVGGQGTISDSVFQGLKSVGATNAGVENNVIRVFGSDRYTTAAAASVANGTSTGGSFTSTFGQASGKAAFLAGGSVAASADALSAGSLAYSQELPVLLTQPASVPQSTLDALQSNAIKNIFVLGGTASVSDANVAQLTGLGYTVTRIAGTNRYGTNKALYDFSTKAPVSAASPTNGGLGLAAPIQPFLANGMLFADALSAGPLAGATVQPLLLTSPAALSPETQAYLVANKATINNVFGVGLSGSLPQSVLDAANQAAN